MSLFRKFFLLLSANDACRRLAENLPLVHRLTSRFVAGTDLETTLDVARRLNDRGFAVTLDHLGENVISVDGAERATRAYRGLLEAIGAHQLDGNISIKLTQTGLDVDEELCYRNLCNILECAARHGNFVRIDMEGSPYTQRTIDLYRRVRADHDNAGLVIQAYLYRSEMDVREIVARGWPVRLCKGAYRESARIAYPKKQDVDASYLRLLEMLLSAEALGRGVHTAVATHDETMIAAARRLVAERGIDRNRMEFQMLYGIRRDLQDALLHEGHRVRIYVPFGTEWYPYFMRRLAERPANLAFVVKNLFAG